MRSTYKLDPIALTEVYSASLLPRSHSVVPASEKYVSRRAMRRTRRWARRSALVSAPLPAPLPVPVMAATGHAT
jgi:hypothetical protein